MNVKGIIKVIGETSVVSDKFKKREIVVTTEGEYKQHISIQFTQSKCELLDKFKAGDGVDVSINLKGREWTPPTGGETKYFNTIEGWKIEKADVEVKEPEKKEAPKDDLPF